MIMIGIDSIYSRSPKIVARKTGDEYILVPVSDNIADMKSVYTMNSTGAFIWEKLDGKTAVNEIIMLVQNEFEIDKKSASDDVLTFLGEMNDFQIITK
ncbi:MAG: PqqD family protein [Bacteroidales bacterium]|nr:PqqD family protein [Bacteroidales bacterium]